jgi:hypothetical protein
MESAGTESTEFGTPFINRQIGVTLGSRNNPWSYPANPALITPLNHAQRLANYSAGPEPAEYLCTSDLHADAVHLYLFSMQMEQTQPKGWVAFGQVYTLPRNTNSNFNALNSRGEYRLGHGLSAGLQYTYSKSINHLSAEGLGFTTNQTYPINDSTERRPSDYDSTHDVRAFAVWSLPMFREQKSVLGKIVGGSQLNGFYQTECKAPAFRHGDMSL